MSIVELEGGSEAFALPPVEVDGKDEARDAPTRSDRVPGTFLPLEGLSPIGPDLACLPLLLLTVPSDASLIPISSSTLAPLCPLACLEPLVEPPLCARLDPEG